MLITKELSTVRELRSERFIGCDAHETGIKPMFILTIAELTALTNKSVHRQKQ